MNQKTSNSRNPGGRPPKFKEPRRPITVTLPERTLRQLNAVDHDRAKAIVKVTEAVVGTDAGDLDKVRLVEVIPGKAVLVVGNSHSLKSIPWLSMAEIAPGSNMLVIPSGTPADSLEIAILDLLDNLPENLAHERPLLEEIRATIGRLRRGQQVSKAELLFFDISSSRGRKTK